jgi:nitroimidazol reductase NimA-like FMN-containing flavoprotein (pyridoxamine 5'-phosphate oxidase superfamily)
MGVLSGTEVSCQIGSELALVSRPLRHQHRRMSQTLSPPLASTPRTRITRHRERGSENRADLFAIIREALICHVGVVRDGAPVVLPSIHAADPDGPDQGGTLYLHGSVAAPWLIQAPGQVVCVTFTLVDAVVLARAAFSHSMNYRSAVVYGAARRVDDAAERDHALRLIVDHVVPGRSATLRTNTRKELAATTVIAVPLAEASVKARTGGPNDEPEDVAAGTWAGVVPLLVRAGAVESDQAGPIPDDVRRRLADW